MEKINSKGLAYDGPDKFEYDFGDPNFTGDVNKLPPCIREIQEKLAKEAFGEREERKVV
jgi:hypothetical protein